MTVAEIILGAITAVGGGAVLPSAVKLLLGAILSRKSRSMPPVPMVTVNAAPSPADDSQRISAIGPQCDEHKAEVARGKALHARLTELKREQEAKDHDFALGAAERTKAIGDLRLEFGRFEARITEQIAGLRREIRAALHMADSDR